MFKTKTEYLVPKQRQHKSNPPPEDQRRGKGKVRNRGTSSDAKFLFRNAKTHRLDKTTDRNVQGNAYPKTIKRLKPRKIEEGNTHKC